MLRKFRCVQILKYYTSATVGISPKLQQEHDNKNICYGRTSSSRSGHNRVQHSQLYNDVTKTVVPAACGQPSSRLRIWPGMTGPVVLSDVYLFTSLTPRLRLVLTTHGAVTSTFLFLHTQVDSGAFLRDGVASSPQPSWQRSRGSVPLASRSSPRVRRHCVVFVCLPLFHLQPIVMNSSI